MLAWDKRAERGSETDVTRGYNSVFLSLKRVPAYGAYRRSAERSASCANT
jgi:hypothetical protein